MTKKDYFTYLLFIAGGIGGWFLGHYSGGVISGICISLVLLALIGKKTALRASSRIDKGIRDAIVENMD